MELLGQHYDFTFKFANNIQKELKTEEKDGFEALTEGLLQRDIDIVVRIVKCLIAQNGIATEDKVIEMLDPIFSSDEKTDQLLEDIFSGLVSSGFLRQKLVSYVKTATERLEMSEKVLETMNDESEKVAGEIALGQMKKNISRLNETIRPH